MSFSNNLKGRLRSGLASQTAATELMQRVDTPVKVQGTPAAETGVATISIADILTGIVTITHSTGATVALTLDTGTLMDAGRPSLMKTDEALDWTLINLSAAAADTATVTASTGHTLVGTMICQSAHASIGGVNGNAICLRSRRTAANTWVTYRLG